MILSLSRVFTIFCFAVFIATVHPNSLFSVDGEVTKVDLFSQYRFPGQPSNKRAGMLIPSNKKFARIELKAKLSCPCAKGLGEWDYTVSFFAHPKTGLLDTAGKPITKNVEIARFITPYWGNRPASMNYAWSWDITDYAYLLKDSIDLSVHYDGWSQSALFDVWLELTEGTPALEVFDVSQMIRGYFPYGNEKDPIDNYTTKKKIIAAPSSEYSKLRIITTGHGGGGTDNAAEFAEKTHQIWIGGQKRFSQHLWNECGFNPVFPQDGTWPIARAGWCPGMEVSYWDWDITSMIGSVDSTSFDYRFQPFTNFEFGAHGSGYGVTVQVMSARKPSFSNNARILEIISPSKHPKQVRSNPICMNPTIMVKNEGSVTIKNLTLVQGFQGAPSQEIVWEGSIAPFESATVTLPDLVSLGLSNSGSYSCTILKVNGVDDEYSLGNSLQQISDSVPVMYRDLEFRFKTNSSAKEQYSWRLNDGAGKVIFDHPYGSAEDNKLYVDSVKLEDGCYEFQLLNQAGIGLNWWATSGQVGIATLSFSSNGKLIKTFPGDIGSLINYQFRVGDKPEAVFADVDTSFDFVTPDRSTPVTKRFTITPGNSAGLSIKSLSLFRPGIGFVVSIDPSIEAGTVLHLSQGQIATVTVTYTQTKLDPQTATLSIGTNDEKNPSKRIVMFGRAEGMSGVETADVPEFFLACEPNPSSDMLNIAFGANALTTTRGTVRLVSALGHEVARIFDGDLTEQKNLSISTDNLASGMYLLIIQSGQFTQSKTVQIQH